MLNFEKYAFLSLNLKNYVFYSLSPRDVYFIPSIVENKFAGIGNNFCFNFL